MSEQNVPLSSLPLFANPAPTTFAPEPIAPAPVPELEREDGADEKELWQRVRRLQGDVSARLTAALTGEHLDQNDREQMGREIIMRVVQEEHDTELEAGRRPWSPAYSARLTQALFDALFRLGRLQRLVEMQDVENIEITGYDKVLILTSSGEKRYAAPIADSDAELVEFLQFLATRDPDNERSFTRSNYRLDLDLPGRGRLSAVGWVVPRPRVTIRLQRLQRVDLALLRKYGTVDHVLEDFLAAAVRARKSIVVSGQGQGSGKTTMLRALCAAIDPWESVATIETDYELYLHEDPERHRRVLPSRSREGSGELTSSGRRAGEVDTSELTYMVLRHNISRVILGEVRGPEIGAMFQAMQMGNGSLSTVHADSASDVPERLVGLALQDSNMSENYAYRQIVQAIDLVVFVSVSVDENGARHRYVSEIIEVTRGEKNNPIAIGQIFRPGPTGRAVPVDAPTFIEDLVKEGFDQQLFAHRDGTWGTTR